MSPCKNWGKSLPGFSRQGEDKCKGSQLGKGLALGVEDQDEALCRQQRVSEDESVSMSDKKCRLAGRGNDA